MERERGGERRRQCRVREKMTRLLEFEMPDIEMEFEILISRPVCYCLGFGPTTNKGFGPNPDFEMNSIYPNRP